MRQKTETVIDGHRYEMTMLPATASLHLFHRLFKMFGPSIGSLIDALGDKQSIQDVDLSSESIITAIQALTVNVGQHDLDFVVSELRGATQVAIDAGDKSVPLKSVFELHFAGRFVAMLQWLMWGLREQYASFFDVFGSGKPPSAQPVSPATSDNQR